MNVQSRPSLSVTRFGPVLHTRPLQRPKGPRRTRCAKFAFGSFELWETTVSDGGSM